MKKLTSILKTTLCLAITGSFLLIYPFISRAQQTVYIESGGTIFAHPQDTVGIFGDVINAGSWGTSPGTVIDFLGNQWQNVSFATLPGDAGLFSKGGVFRFIGSKQQILQAGYQFNQKNGPSFPNLSIENPSGVQLADLNDLYIRGNLHFSGGNLYLNGWNAVVGDSITGYSAGGFVVTGDHIGGGMLYREPQKTNRMLVFPVGTETTSYSPLALKTTSSFSNFVGVRVFDHVYEKATNGTIRDSDYVKKTWQLAAAQGVPQTTVLLQHQEADEGIRFNLFRDSSYVSRYNLSAAEWDMDDLPHTVASPGTLTTAKPLRNTYLNDRMFTEGIPAETEDSISWLSVSTTAFSNITCPVADFKLWAAQRYSYRWVQLFWRTLREMNVDTYEVQRRRDTASAFTTIETVNSKGMGGFSNHLLYYYYADDNTYDGWTYYRLKMTSASGCVVYTELQGVPWGIGVEVWPNPSPGDAHVRIIGIKRPVVLQVVNTWGQILRQYTVDRDGTIDLKALPDAIYFLVIRDPKNSNQKVTTVKLVVQHTQ